MPDQSELFTVEPTPGDPPRPVSELNEIHRQGETLLRTIIDTDPDRTVYRVRAAEDLDVMPERRWQVTVRHRTASRRPAAEWTRLVTGELDAIVYGFLQRPDGRITDFVVIEPAELHEDIRTRPNCMLPVPSPGRGHMHHAPGGAEFVVVDIRRCRPAVVRSSTFRIDHDPAPVAEQGAMF